MADWDEIESAFRKALSAVRVTAETPADIPAMSRKEKEVFVKMFQNFDKLFAQLKSFTNYEHGMLESYGMTESEYEDYAGHYANLIEELRQEKPDTGDDPDAAVIDYDYELMAYSNTKIDYEYIINLIQNIVTPENSDENITPEERRKKIEEIKQYIEELRKENPKQEYIEKVIDNFCLIWFASKEEVMYAATHYRNGEIPNESAIKATIDFTSYKAARERALPKFKYYAQMMAELRKTLDEEIKPLIIH